MESITFSGRSLLTPTLPLQLVVEVEVGLVELGQLVLQEPLAL